MKKIESQILSWIDTQKKAIEKAQGAFESLKGLLSIRDEELDTATIEALSQDITQYFDIISQYHYTITAIVRDLSYVPPLIVSKMLQNQNQIGALVDTFNILSDRADKKLRSIQSKLYYANQFILQLSQT